MYRVGCNSLGKETAFHHNWSQENYTMVRFMTGTALLALVVAVTGSEIVDPMDVALAATEEATTTIQEPELSGGSHASNSTHVTPVVLPEPNTKAAISDSISNVMVEESIDLSASASAPEDAEQEDVDSASSASDSAPTSDSSHVTPAIALASLTAIAVTGLFL